MSDLGEQTTAAIRAGSPALAAALSPLGRRVAFPPGIPFQAAEARGAELNATIGQITDGRGSAVPLPPMAAALGGLAPEDRNRAFLNSPVEGLPELRQRWREWQRRGGATTPSSLPLVTVGLTHGLSLAADLFAGEGRAVAVPAPFWGNYRQTFEARTGARLLAAPAYRDGRFNPEALAEALAGLPAGEPAVAIVNVPSNPGGYSPTVDERAELRDSLLGVARRRPLVVLCDDAYAGLVYEEGIPPESMFWELAGLDPNLVPVKIDGGTKEFSFFGGRVGFLTFPFEPESEAAAALESKVKCLVRATVGSPVAASQAVLLQALRDGGAAAHVEAVRALLAGRYRALKGALAGADRELFTPLPFNSGCFALLELSERLGTSAEAARKRLLAEESTGLVSVGERFLRIAFCSVDETALPELVRRIERGLAIR